MNLPIYETMNIPSAQKDFIHNLLDQIDFGKNPFVFNLLTLTKEEQEQALVLIESYLEFHKVNHHSYPLFFLAQVNQYSGDLKVRSKKELIPSFFYQKRKQLSATESTKMNMIELKQTQLNQLEKTIFQKTLKNYSDQHKKIYHLEKELNFLTDIEMGIQND